MAYDVDGCINISQLNFLKGKCLLFLTPVRTLAANCAALTITLLQNQKLCTLINYSYMYYNVYMHIMHVHVLWRQQILVFATYIFVWHVIHITHLSTCNNLGFFFNGHYFLISSYGCGEGFHSHDIYNFNRCTLQSDCLS